MSHQARGVYGNRGVLLAAVALIGVFLAAHGQARAETLSPSVLGMFPKQLTEFVYVDLKTVRLQPWFAQVQQEFVPGRLKEFAQFVTGIGVDPSAQVDGICWGEVAVEKGRTQIVGVAVGRFETASIEEDFKQKKVPFLEIRGFKAYAYGTGAGSGALLFTFLDSSTAAFGQRAALESLLEVRTGAAQGLFGNDKLYRLINQANGTSVSWAVLDQNYTRITIQRLVPETGQFPQVSSIVKNLQAMTIKIGVEEEIDIEFDAVCSSPDDANLLAAALQAGLMFRKYQRDALSSRELGTILDQVRVMPSGDRLQVKMKLSQVQLQALLISGVLTI